MILDERTRNRTLLAIVAVAFASRVGFIFYLDPGRIYFPDTIIYNKAAESLLAGHGFGPYLRLPGYPLFLAAVQAVFPGSLLAIKIVDAFLGCTVVLLTYLLGREIWGERVGLLGASLVAVHPYLVVLSAFLYAETLFTALLLLAVWLLLRATGVRGALVAGVIGGLATLTKVSGLALFPAGAAWLLFAGVGPRRRRLAMMAVFVLGGVAATLPWEARNYERLGDVSLLDARTKLHLQEGGSPLGLAVERRAYRDNEVKKLNIRSLDARRMAKQFVRFWSLSPDHLSTADREFRTRMAVREKRMVVDGHLAERMQQRGLLLTLLLFPYYLCAVLGLWFARRRFDRSSLLFLLILCTALGRAVFHARLRYRLPVEPEIALFAALGLVSAWQVLASRVWTSRQAAPATPPALIPEAASSPARPTVGARTPI